MRRIMKPQDDKHDGQLEVMISTAPDVLQSKVQSAERAEDIFGVLDIEDYETFKNNLGWLDRLTAKQRYAQYTQELKRKQTELDHLQQTYVKTVEEIRAQVRSTDTTETWLTHDVRFLEHIKQEMEHVRQGEDDFISTYINSAFIKALLYIQMIVIALGPDHQITKLFNKYFGPLLERPQEEINKKQLLESMLHMKDELQSEKGLADELHWKLMQEAVEKYKALENPQDALQKHIQRFETHIQQLHKELTEHKQTREKMEKPEQMYQRIEDALLQTANNENEATANMMITYVKKEVATYKDRYEGLQGAIEQQQSAYEQAIKDYGEFLQEEYSAYLLAKQEEIKSISTNEIKQGQSIEAVGEYVDHLRKQIYQSSALYTDAIERYNQQWLRSTTPTTIQQEVATLQQDTLKQIFSKLTTWFEKDSRQKYENQDATLKRALKQTMEENNQQADKIWKGEVAKHCQQTQQDYEQKREHILQEESKIQPLLQEFTTALQGVPEGIQGEFMRTAAGYFPQEKELYRILRAGNSAKDAYMQAKSKAQVTLGYSKNENALPLETYTAYMQSLAREDAFTYTDRGAIYEQIETAGIGEESAWRKYVVLKNARTVHITQEQIIFQTYDGNIWLTPHTALINDLLSGEQPHEYDYKSLAQTKLLSVRERSGESNTEVFDQLIGIAADSEHAQAIHAMIRDMTIPTTPNLTIPTQDYTLDLGRGRLSDLRGRLWGEVKDLNLMIRTQDVVPQNFRENERAIKSERDLLATSRKDDYTATVREQAGDICWMACDPTANITFDGGFVMTQAHGSDFYIFQDGEERKVYKGVLISNGVVRVEKNKKYGFLNTKGEQIGGWYDRAENFKDGFARVRNDKRSFINTSGEQIGEWYDAVEDYKDGFAIVGVIDNEYRKRKYGFINTSGEQVGGWYDEVEEFKDGFAVVKKGDKRSFINMSGKQIGGWYDKVKEFKDGFAIVIDNKYRNSGFINTSGEQVGGWYDEVEEFKDGFAVMKKGDKRSFINMSGEQIGGWYDNVVVKDFKDGFTIVGVFDNEYEYREYGFINTSGERIGGWYDEVYGFKEGFAPVKKDGKFSFINTKGEQIGEWYGWIGSFDEGFAPVKKDGKFSFINTKGEQIVGWYDAVEDYKDRFIIVEKDGVRSRINPKNMTPIVAG